MMEDTVPDDLAPRTGRSQLVQILRFAYRGKWTGIAVAALAIVATILFFQSIDFKYRARLTVGPAQQESGLSRSLGGLASLAGVNIARGQAASPFVLYLQMLHSHDIAKAIQKDHATMIRLFPNRWDASSQTWRAPTGFVADVARFVKGIVGMDATRSPEPSVAEVEKLLEERLAVVENRRDSLAEISYANSDPKFAADFVRMVSKTADELLRVRGLDRANRFSAYLNRQLGIVQIAELRNTIADALGEQEKQRMIALSGLAFAAETVGGITVSARASEPNPMLVLASGAMAAIVLGVLAAYLRGRSRR